MTYRPTLPQHQDASAHRIDDALKRLVRLLARQAAREAFGGNDANHEDHNHVHDHESAVSDE